MNTVSFEIKDHKVLLDEEDLLVVASLKWHLLKTKRQRVIYAQASPQGKISILMHRLIMAVPPDMEIDHINCDGLDNRKSNLRFVTRSQNQWNVLRRRDNTSGYKGVSWHPAVKRWSAHIFIDGKSKYLGSFTTPAEAHNAYCEAVTKMRDQYART